MLLTESITPLLQGVAPAELVRRYGAPLYVYDVAVIGRQYKKLTDAFADVPSLRINYACKALTNINILKYMRRLGASVDCVSIEEVALCLGAGFAAEQIGYTPSGVAWEEILEAVALKVRIHIDSISLLKKFGEAYGNSIPVSLRLNPHVLAGGNLKISTGHAQSKFGISIELLPEIHQVIQKTGLIVEGLHQHTGSEIKEADVFLQVAEIMFGAARSFPHLKYLDFGGGFKVPVHTGEIGTDMLRLGTKIAERFNEFCAEYGRVLTLVWEPGKFLVSECGSFLTRVNVVKRNPAVTFAHVDSGLNHLIRPMFYDAWHEIENVSNPGGPKELYDVVGYICETDTFASKRPIAEIREGDLLLFRNAGAYGWMMASNYNSRPRPAEVMIYEGKDYLIRSRETMADILKNQIDAAISL